ncbi:MBL fold metallo-hydrolase [Sphingomonas oleivorans]|nr:MBL fold metallo-hydrolase [Sphingomonas oleivorans]
MIRNARCAWMRRCSSASALGTVLAALFLVGTSPAVSAAPPALRIHLLGTGGPELTPDRAGYATLVEGGDTLLLFDAGRGILQRLYEQRINPKRITRIFLTHLHSDHIAGLPDLWITPWFLLGRTAPLEIWGPPGTRAMVSGMLAMYGHDVASRVNRFNPAGAIAVTVHELAPGTIFDRDGMRVTAFAVEHDDGNPAFGYRIDRAGHAAVLSGDTTYSANVVAAAQDVDLVVSNVIAFSPRLSALPEMQGVLAKLTTPEQAARLFVETRPKLAIFSHIVKKELGGAPGDAAILSRVRAAGYSGPLAMGHDREVIELGKSVTLLPPPSIVDLPDLDSKSAPF